MPALPGRHHALSVALLLSALGCGPGAKATHTNAPEWRAPFVPGVEVHAASGRPRLVVVRRDGDPSAAIAVELRGNDPLRLAVVSAIVGARLEKAGFGGVQVIAGTTLARVRALAPQIGAPLAAQLDAVLTRPVAGDDAALVAARHAIDAFAARPVDDPALARATRCLDRPVRPVTFTPPAIDEVPALAESLRAAQIRADAVAVAAVASTGGDAFAQAWRALPVMAGSTNPFVPEAPTGSSSVTSALTHEGGILVVEGGPRSALPSALATLSRDDGPLALRLRAADDFRARGVSGASRPEGACVVVEVEPAQKSKETNPERVAMRTAVALEVARQEIELALDAARSIDDGDASRAAIGSGGDPREAADRAAFWGWPLAETSKALVATSTLALPAAAIAKGPQVDVDAALASIGPKFSAAVARAKLAWTRPEIELRGHVEAGQGELWAALASTCSVAHEAVPDAGVAAVAMRALVAHAGEIDGVTLEPWSAAAGVGLVAHAAPRPKESPRDLARRVGDVLGRVFLAGFPSSEAVARARGDALSILGSNAAPSELVRTALHAASPARPSWLEPLGLFDSVAKVGELAIDLRLATLRASPVRLAILANEADAQIDAVAHAVERWAPRRPGEARACPVIDAGAVAKGAVHPLVVKTGTGVALSMPIEESQREAATTLAAVLDGPSGRLGAEVAGIATSWEARVVRGVGRSALVIVVLAPDSNVDTVVAKVRALLERLRGGGVEAADLARAEKERDRARMLRHLDPRARVVDLFASDATVAVDLAQVRAVAAKVLEEDRTQLVVARLK